MMMMKIDERSGGTRGVSTQLRILNIGVSAQDALAPPPRDPRILNVSVTTFVSD
jgi:hypothetical protein